MVVSNDGFQSQPRERKAARRSHAAACRTLVGGEGDWDAAHKIVMNEDSRDAAWVHAYLHRVEGDLSNAGYWYRRADKPVAKDALDAEWQRIVDALEKGDTP